MKVTIYKEKVVVLSHPSILGNVSLLHNLTLEFSVVSGKKTWLTSCREGLFAMLISKASWLRFVQISWALI